MAHLYDNLNPPLEAPDQAFIDSFETPFERFDARQPFYESNTNFKYYAPYGHITYLDITDRSPTNPTFSIMPPSFQNLTHLEYCRLSNVHFSSFVHFPPSLPDLKTLIFSSCYFDNFASFPTHMPQLEFIALGGIYPLDYLPDTLPNLKYVSISRNDDITFHSAIWDKLFSYSTIEKLWFMDSHLTSLPPHPTFYSHLRELMLSSNSLSSLEFLPKNLPHLITLDIHSNNFLSFASFPTHMPKLECLIISFNPIKSLTGLSKPVLTRLLDPAIVAIALERFFSHSFPNSFKDKLPPDVYSWIETGDVDQVHRYFATPIADLCHHIVAGHEPTVLELQRLSTEITRYDLHYLEANLPADHPLLGELSGLFSVSTFCKDDSILF